MRLCFINPPAISKFNRNGFIRQGETIHPVTGSFPPLGIGYLAAVAEKSGHTCNVFDLKTTPWISGKQILDLSADLVLISALTIQYSAVKAVIGELRGKVPLVIGGPHASIFKEALLNDGVDIVAVGEGEETLISLLRNFPGRLESVPGIIFKKNGNYINTGEPTVVNNLDTLPFPAWHDFNLDMYHNYYYGRRCFPVISSRGCPYKCVYCFKGVSGDKIRTRSAESIFDEIIFLKGKYNIGAVQFQDDLFTINRARVESFCNLLLDNKTDIFWRCLARVDQVDRELLLLMKEAGCKSLAFGIESGNQEMLERIGKKITLKQVAKAIELCNEIGIVSKGYYIIGLPGETAKTAQDTINFARKNRTTQLQFTLPLPYPGTELWDIGKKMGLPVEKHVETFFWDDTLTPYSFSEHLTPRQIERYILIARNIGQRNMVLRFFKMLGSAKPAEYPVVFLKAFRRLRSMMRVNFK
ncbi:radical SAM protein [bacterium]|nr:MAG: radical SAM protein [bacterium]